MKTYAKQLLDFFNRHRIHFIAWSLFITYEVVTAGIMRGFATFGNYAVYYVFNIASFYFHAHVVLPASRMKTRQALWRLPLLTMLEVLIYVPLVMGTADILSKYGDLTLINPITYNLKSYVNNAYRCIYFLFFASGYYFILNYIKERQLAEKREKEKLLVMLENQKISADLIRSQHAHLKAQINPHFLFNTLNFIYMNTRKKAPEAAEAIMALSEMMRYAIGEVGEDNRSLLADELIQVENLIHLHQLKSEQKLHIYLEYDDQAASHYFIPLVVLTLTENIFKHGDLMHEEHPALISIAANEETLRIETQNLIRKNPTTQTSHHIGLDNIKTRLQSAYGDKAYMEHYKDEANYFYVKLELALTVAHLSAPEL